MSTFLTIVLSILAIIGLLFLYGVYKLKSKVAKGTSWLKVEALDEARKEISKKLAEPDLENDAELSSLGERVETALTGARAAYEKGDYNLVSEIADPLLTEIFELIKRKAEEAQQEQEEKVVEGEVIEDATILPAPPRDEETRD